MKEKERERGCERFKNVQEIGRYKEERKVTPVSRVSIE
jgi:hypothetical protein